VGDAARPPWASAAAVGLELLGGVGDGVDQRRDAAVLQLARLADHVAIPGDDVIDAEIDQEALVLGQGGGDDVSPDSLCQLRREAADSTRSSDDEKGLALL